MDTINSMAQGLGGLIQQWVLYGSAGPNAIRKMIAAVLAQAAAQAAVEAIMQLAYAWKETALASASAAIFDVRGAALHSAAAAAHLTSAGVFGAVAGVAAVAGRVVAGSSFTDQGGASGGRSGSGASGGTSNRPATVEVDRRGSNFQTTVIQPIVNVTITGEATQGFRYIVERALTESLNENGVVRKIQNGDFV